MEAATLTLSLCDDSALKGHSLGEKMKTQNFDIYNLNEVTIQTQK